MESKQGMFFCDGVSGVVAAGVVVGGVAVGVVVGVAVGVVVVGGGVAVWE